MTTLDATEITDTSAKVGVEASGIAISARGVIYGTTLNPGITMTCGQGSGGFIILTGLTPSTKYYYKAFAYSQEDNNYGYGEVKSFTTTGRGGD